MLPNPNEMRREQVRRASNRERALEALMRAGERGILNLDLMAIAGSRAGGRVDELRQQGHRITCEQVERGVYRYTLQSEARRQAVAIPDSLPAATGGLLFDLHALTD
jgi:hypothetical protein